MQIIQSTKSVVQTICPYVNGSAVYKARGIYAMFVPGVDYDDMEVCNSIGVYKGGESLYEKENEVLGIINQKPISDLRIYPNPTSEVLTLEFSPQVEMKGELMILDLLGNVIQYHSINSNLNITTVHLKKLNSGIYIYKFVDDNEKIYTGKLVIE
jgi:hypothetical protein